MNATTFNSLNSIIDDILLTYRDSKISESEDLSRIQVEQWIHQYRALLIKQDLDKGRDMNEQYLQTITPLHISKLSKEFIKDPGEVLSVGEIIKCYVDKIDLEKKQVSLSLIKE